MRRRRAAFSLVEMIVVIGIIALLATIAFVAFGAVRRSQEQRSTRATMETARTLFNAFVAAGQTGGNTLARDTTGAAVGFYLRLAPPTWKFNDAAYNPAATPQEIEFRKLTTSGNAAEKDYVTTIDYYNVPRRQGDVKTGIPVPMNAPLAEAGDDTAAWVDPAKNWQLVATLQTIRRLRGSPDGKAVWSTLRESQIVHVGPDASQQDFLIDAWGHPLLFVPGSGLRAVRYGTGELKAGDPVSYVKADPSSAADLEFQGLRSPDGRAFWVSAGPDGYYDTQDDNLYSFDN